EVVIDPCKEYNRDGLTSSPPHDRWHFGIAGDRKYDVSRDDKKWKQAASGESGNTQNNPIEQTVTSKPMKGRYIKLKGLRATDESGAISIGEVGVITTNKK